MSKTSTLTSDDVISLRQHYVLLCDIVWYRYLRENYIPRCLLIEHQLKLAEDKFWKSWEVHARKRRRKTTKMPVPVSQVQLEQEQPQSKIEISNWPRRIIGRLRWGPSSITTSQHGTPLLLVSLTKTSRTRRREPRRIIWDSTPIVPT